MRSIEFLRALASQTAANLWRHKLRSFLTMFGIVWGTTAVSLLMAFGQAMHHQMLKNTAGLGNAIVIVFPSLTSMPSCCGCTAQSPPTAGDGIALAQSLDRIGSVRGGGVAGGA